MFSKLLAAATGMTNAQYTWLLIGKIICFSLLFIGSVAIIICVMFQTTENSSGTNVMTGQNESFYAQNKNKTREGRLRLITIISAVVIFVVSIILTLLVTKL